MLLQRERQEGERSALAELQPAMALDVLEERAESARDAGQKAAAELQELLAEITVTRDRERVEAQALNALRTRWQDALGSQVSTEALQTAALGKASGKITEWLKSKSLDRQPRVAQQLRVDRGWERAVETVRYTLYKHDEHNPEDAVFPALLPPLPDAAPPDAGLR